MVRGADIPVSHHSDAIVDGTSVVLRMAQEAAQLM